jgi:murein DD-endopeptidase MepM/ murein hydrolase activator NlpD
MTQRAHTVRRRMRPRLLVSLCALTLLVWAVLPVGSGAVQTNQQKLSELQEKIERTQGKIGRKKGAERVLTSDIAAWSAKIGRLQKRIGGLERRQSAVQADLDDAAGELEATRGDLRRQRARQVRLKARLALGRRLLAKRLVERYQADAPDLVTVMLSSDGFAELLERGEFLKRINDQDERIIRVVRSAKGDAASNAKRLAVLETRQERIAARIQSRRDEIAGVKQELIDTRVGFDRTRQGKASALSGIRSERRRLEGALSEMKETQAKIQGILTSPGGGTLPAGPIRGGSGSMIWPVNGPITSPFCERRSWESCHPGIDIGVPSGTPIRAALGGRVALAAPTSGYGNYTCIQHSASLSTCYAHQSRYAASAGQQVSKGQVIGYVGCTGFCFGDHLHFEVRVNGSVVNPMGYL